MWLRREPVDFRRQINGLVLIVEQEMEADPFAKRVYAFTNRRRDRARLLYWDRNGFALWLNYYYPSREGEVAERLLEGFQGYLQTDGYSGYNALGAREGIVHVGCFAPCSTQVPRGVEGPGRRQEKREAEKGLEGSAGFRVVPNALPHRARAPGPNPEGALPGAAGADEAGSGRHEGVARGTPTVRSRRRA